MVTSERQREIFSFCAAERITSGKDALSKLKSTSPYRCQHEKEYAERSRSLGIPFEYESRAFEIDLNGKIRRWIPDFYLPETDEYIEINCATNPLKNKKVEAFRNQYPLIKLTILMRPGHRLAKIASPKIWSAA